MQNSRGLRTTSPVKVVITRAVSPERPSSGRLGSGRQKSTVISKQRRGSLQPMDGRNPASCLNVPGLNDSVEKLTIDDKTKGNNFNNSDRPRSRSGSPFKKEREQLPSGSPTFQRVLYEILAETEIDTESTDDERSSTDKQSSLQVPKANKNNAANSRRRTSLSPSVHFRRKSVY